MADKQTLDREVYLPVGRPSSLRYRQLIADLARAERDLRAGHNDLSAVFSYLVSVAKFLDADPLVANREITRPLNLLIGAVRDLALGAKPALFFNRKKKGAGRPTGVSFDLAKGAAAAVLDVLIECNESRDEAAKFVARELGLLGSKSPTGNAVQPAQLLRWRDEIYGRAPALANKQFKELRAGYTHLFLPSDTRETRHALARECLRAVRSMGF